MNELILSLTQRTAQILTTKQKELAKIVWVSGESNLEEGYANLAGKCCLEAWSDIQKEIPEYANTTLIATLPDITLVFNHKGDEIHGKIELKSGLSEEIPGSTIGKLDINQPTIFCLRPKKGSSEYKFRYSQYYSSMILTENDCFQDRSPRPKISFKKMVDCNTPIEYVNKEKGALFTLTHYAECAIRRLNNGIKSWQDTLTSLIIDYYLKTTPLAQIIERHKLLESAEPSSQ